MPDETTNPIETVKGTPGSNEDTEDEKKADANRSGEAREDDDGSVGRKPGEADAPIIPEEAKPNFE